MSIPYPEINRGALWAEYNQLTTRLPPYLDDLKDIIVKSGSTLEGNCFYIHETLNLFRELFFKQVNLFWCGKFSKKRVCEIGFNAGHSALLMLLGSENKELKQIQFTIFDIGEHSYTRPALKYIESKFPDVSFEYIEGDSIVEMPKWIDKNNELKGTYDVVHVDGGHTYNCLKSDMANAGLLVKPGGLIIVDDTNVAFISTYVDEYINSGIYRELTIFKTMGYRHRIIQKVG